LQKWEQEEASLRELQRFECPPCKRHGPSLAEKKSKASNEQRRRNSTVRNLQKPVCFPSNKCSKGSKVSKNNKSPAPTGTKCRRPRSRKPPTVELEKLKPAYEQREHMKLKAQNLEVLQGIAVHPTQSATKGTLQKGGKLFRKSSVEWQASARRKDRTR